MSDEMKTGHVRISFPFPKQYVYEVTTKAVKRLGLDQAKYRVNVDTETLPEQILAMLFAYGIDQKLGDKVASNDKNSAADLNKCHADTIEFRDQLYKGIWSERRAGIGLTDEDKKVRALAKRHLNDVHGADNVKKWSEDEFESKVLEVIEEHGETLLEIAQAEIEAARKRAEAMAKLKINLSPATDEDEDAS